MAGFRLATPGAGLLVTLALVLTGCWSCRSTRFTPSDWPILLLHWTGPPLLPPLLHRPIPTIRTGCLPHGCVTHRLLHTGCLTDHIACFIPVASHASCFIRLPHTGCRTGCQPRQTGQAVNFTPGAGQACSCTRFVPVALPGSLGSRLSGGWWGLHTVWRRLLDSGVDCVEAVVATRRLTGV